MEAEEDDDLRLPSPCALTAAASAAVLPLGVLCLTGAARGAPKPLSVAIKVADGVLFGTKALQRLHSPASPESLLIASKALAKTYKVSKRLNLIGRGVARRSLSRAAKRLKPYIGAIDLVRYVRNPVSDAGFLGFGLVTYGYKFSKNFVRVLEGFVGVEVDAAVRSGFDTVGLVVKAVQVAREIERIADVGVGRSSCRFMCAKGLRSRYALCSSFTRLNDGCGPCGVGYVERSRLGGLPIRGMDLGWEGKARVCNSELLCLAVPVEGRFRYA